MGLRAIQIGDQLEPIFLHVAFIDEQIAFLLNQFYSIASMVLTCMDIKEQMDLACSRG